MEYIYHISKVQRWVKVFSRFSLLAFLPLLLACDHIAEGDQLIYVPLPPAKRVVLLEDFTGQRCSNCPTGTTIIESLLASENGDNLIAVAIHSGPLGKTANQKSLLSLATETGNEYFDRWMTGKGQPIGQINRLGAMEYQYWTNKVLEEMKKESYVEMQLTAMLQDGQIVISVEEKSLKGIFNGKVQVWVTEDGIVDSQYMPDGKVNREYVHNHVFRTAVNGTWGEDFTVNEGNTEKQTYTQAVAPVWNTANLSIVAFVYNDDGVEQAVKAKVEELKI